MQGPTQFMQATVAQQAEQIESLTRDRDGCRAEIRRLAAILDPYHAERRYCPGCQGQIKSLVQAAREVDASERVPTRDKEVIAHLAARDKMREALKAFTDIA